MSNAYTKGNIVHALTEWDRIQSARDKHHNPYFLPIALRALDESGAEGGTPQEIAERAFTGRVLAFVLKTIE